MAKVVRKGLEAKLAALNGAEWDSMSEDSQSGDEADGQHDGELKPPPLPVHAQKKGKRKGKGTGASVVPVGPAGQPSGVVYIGHIPHGFYEEAMNGFFKQFGDVVRVRISRSKRSGRCKGYAYVEFSSPEVASIVAETMNGYYLFDKQVVCRVLRFDEIHPNLFDGAGVKFRKVNWHGLYRQKYNADRTPTKDAQHVKKLVKKDKDKRAKLAALGIEYDFPGFVATLKDREVAKGPFQEGTSRKGKDEKKKGGDVIEDVSDSVSPPSAVAPSSEPAPSPAQKGKDSVAGTTAGSKKLPHEGDRKTPTKTKAKSPAKEQSKTPPAKAASAAKTPPSSKAKKARSPSASIDAEAPSSKEENPTTPASSAVKRGTKSSEKKAGSAAKKTKSPKSSTPKGSARKRRAEDVEGEVATGAGEKRQTPKSAKRSKA